MGQPKLILYSLVIQPPDPLFKLYHPAIKLRSSCPRCPREDSFVVDNDESIPELDWTPGPQTGKWEQFRTISVVPSSINLSTPLLGHFTPQPEQSNYPANEGWRWQEDIQAWANHHHVIQMPNFPCKQTPLQPTPGPRGTQWLKDLFRQPSQPNEPPIPGPSQPSEPHEDTSTHEPEPEVALMQSTEEPFAGPATPVSIIIIDNMPIGSHPPVPLIPTMRLGSNLRTCDRPS
ncbi:hypothetical protein O181_010144 [Austropuccinia psidii MF-1]|uniref:Uncharacterized protein n=1 Tax=Austropuccinia psidii MF-1 TaxID=1389203 RepID=A0A9Q3BQG9_9BASI|nr:hypothetical protein [Austropuccinia psidii MF-1]